MVEQELQDRFSALAGTLTGLTPAKIESVAGGGSSRKYFRITVNPREDDGTHADTFVGTYGKDPEENRAFIYLSRHFRSKGLNVPEVLAHSDDGHFYIQTDLGDTSLFDYYQQARQSGLYQDKDLLLKTISALPELQFKGGEGLDWESCYPEPEFCRRTIMSDLNYFKFCFLKASGLEYNEATLDKEFDILCDLLLQGDGQTFMFRDFQARNIMVKDGEPYFIDFQGGRKGPLYYDLVSFIWQARAAYPSDLKNEMIEAYLQAASSFTTIDRADFMDKIQLFLLFRTLQVLGAYGFRGLFERKPHFLKSLPKTSANIREILASPCGSLPYLYSLLEQVLDLSFMIDNQDSMQSEHSGQSDNSEQSEQSDHSGQLKQSEHSERLTVTVCSFSYKKGLPADESGNGGGYVFDCRAIHNPGRYEQYRHLTGMDRPVAEFLETKTNVASFLEHVFALVDDNVNTYLRRGFTHLMVCFGCTGGQHRSVYCAEMTAEHLKSNPMVDVRLFHREQQDKTTNQKR